MSKKILKLLCLLLLSIQIILPVTLSTSSAIDQKDLDDFANAQINKFLQNGTANIGPCATTETKLKAESDDGGGGGKCDPSGKPLLVNLQNAIDKNLIYQFIYEPISDENILFITTICQNEPLIKPNKQLQIVTQGSDKFLTLGESTCVTLYTEKCNPSGSTTNKLIKLNADADGQSLPDKEIPKAVYCQRAQVFFGITGTGLLQQYVGTMYKFAVSVGSVIAIVLIIINGIRVTVGETELATAKENIVRTLSALALLLLSGVILNIINPNFFKAEITQAPVSEQSGQAEAQAEGQ